MLKWLWSLVCGRKVGERVFSRSSPSFVGDPIHFWLMLIPIAKWTSEEENTYFMCFDMREWDGWRLVFKKTIQLSMALAKENSGMTFDCLVTSVLDGVYSGTSQVVVSNPNNKTIRLSL